MGAKLDLTGKRFGRLVVLREDDAPRRKWSTRRLICRCSCGREKSILLTSLTGGRTESCGCLRLELQTRHGGARRTAERSRTYNAWRQMYARCYTTKTKVYPRYGGRGIKVCERWLDDFIAFKNDMGDHPGPGYSLDRIDNDGDYEPGNCRWATSVQQSRNRSNSMTVTYKGERMNVGELADRVGMARSGLRHHVRSGVDVEFAVARYLSRKH